MVGSIGSPYSFPMRTANTQASNMLETNPLIFTFNGKKIFLISSYVFHPFSVKASIMNKTAFPNEVATLALSEGEALSNDELIWCVRGLALRSYPNLGPWVDALLGRMDDSMADKVALIVSPPSQNDTWVFNTARFNLTRQKIFALTKGRLVEAYNKVLVGSWSNRLFGLRSCAQLPEVTKCSSFISNFEVFWLF